MTLLSRPFARLARGLAVLALGLSVAAGPVLAVQPDEVLSDPALEKRSAGQKIMLRMGADNMARAKRLLSAIRSELLRRSPGK